VVHTGRAEHALRPDQALHVLVDHAPQGQAQQVVLDLEPGGPGLVAGGAEEHPVGGQAAAVLEFREQGPQVAAGGEEELVGVQEGQPAESAAVFSQAVAVGLHLAVRPGPVQDLHQPGLHIGSEGPGHGFARAVVIEHEALDPCQEMEIHPFAQERGLVADDAGQAQVLDARWLHGSGR